MSKKIHFQGFIRQQLLQSDNLFTQDQLAGSRARRVCFFESIAPIVKQSPGIPSSLESPRTLSQDFFHSKAWRRNSLLYRYSFFRSTLLLLSRKVCIIELFPFKGSLHEVHQKSYIVNPSLRQNCASHLL